MPSVIPNAAVRKRYSFSWGPLPPNLLTNINIKRTDYLEQALQAMFFEYDTATGKIISSAQNIDSNWREGLGLKATSLHQWVGDDLTVFSKWLKIWVATELYGPNAEERMGPSLTGKEPDTIWLDFPIVNTGSSESPKEAAVPTQQNVVTDNIYFIKSGNIIGQPTLTYYQGQLQIQTVHPLDSNIKPNGMFIQIPTPMDFVRTSATVGNPYKDLSIFNQPLKVQKVNHFGKFRDTSHQGWVTVVNTSFIPGGSS